MTDIKRVSIHSYLLDRSFAGRKKSAIGNEEDSESVYRFQQECL